MMPRLSERALTGQTVYIAGSLGNTPEHADGQLVHERQQKCQHEEAARSHAQLSGPGLKC